MPNDVANAESRGPAPSRRARPTLRDWRNRLVASRRFQAWAARFPLTRGVVRRDGAAIFDIVAGFCHSQILAALVEFDVFSKLDRRSATAADLALQCSVPVDRMLVLLRAGVALGLLRFGRSGHFALSRKGAALTGVPGLTDMIRHHRAFYRDLEDPAAFFRGEGRSELASFWPYVFGAAAADDHATAATYSDLMARSQVLVAEDTLNAVSLKGVRRLMDVGGGTGAFLTAVAARYPELDLSLFDLPAVVAGAGERFAETRMADRVAIHSGSFREDPLPQGADAISLIRVLYDHSDATVRALLAAAHACLPPGGRLLISEPMSGGDQPERPGDAYFAVYTLGMGTGRTRSPEEIVALCAEVGFAQINSPRPARSFVTRVLTAVKPA